MKKLIVLFAILIMSCSNDSVLELEELTVLEKAVAISTIWEQNNALFELELEVQNPLYFLLINNEECYNRYNFIELLIQGEYETTVLQNNSQALKLQLNKGGEMTILTFSIDNNEMVMNVLLTGQSPYDIRWQPSDKDVATLNYCQ